MASASHVLLVLLLAAALLSPLEGLICYSCVYSASDKSKACVDNPDAVTSGSPRVTCKKEQKYCTIRRQEILSTGEVSSFFRGCEEDPSVKDDVMTDDTFRTYFRSCQSNLCNSGDGRNSIGGGGPIRDPGAYGSLIVPGIGNLATPLSAPLLALVLLATLFAAIAAPRLGQ